MERIDLSESFYLGGLYPVGKKTNEMIRLAEVLANAFKVHSRNEKPLNIFCRGSSGAMLAALFVTHMGERECTIIHVKKEGESSHSIGKGGCSHSDVFNNGVNVIIDDFMRSGETINNIYEAFKKHAPKKYNHTACEWEAETWEVDYLMMYNHCGVDVLEFTPKVLIAKRD